MIQLKKERNPHRKRADAAAHDAFSPIAGVGMFASGQLAELFGVTLLELALVRNKNNIRGKLNDLGVVTLSGTKVAHISPDSKRIDRNHWRLRLENGKTLTVAVGGMTFYPKKALGVVADELLRCGKITRCPDELWDFIDMFAPCDDHPDETPLAKVSNDCGNFDDTVDDTAVSTFNHPDFGSIRSVMIDGEPWLVGKDVAAALGYQNGSRDINRHVDVEDRQNYQNGTFDSPRGMTIINESGLYALILSSKLPQAKKFKRWVTKEVLPAIRRTGEYRGSFGGVKSGLTEIHYDIDTLVQQQVATVEAIAGLAERVDRIDRKVARIDRTSGFSNYYLRLQMRSGYDQNWKDKWMRYLKAVSKSINVPLRTLLSKIYAEMEFRYGVRINDFVKDYREVKHLNSCSAFEVVSTSEKLRRMFENILNEIMAECGIEKQDVDRCEWSPLMDFVHAAVRIRDGETECVDAGHTESEVFGC